MTQSPSIFESFNARSLDPKQVAETFVPSLMFRKLAKRRHTIIVGPRGSGKTTLLKMLQQPALEAWNHLEAERYRSRIDFTGIFVPTDLLWSEQLKSLGEGLDSKAFRLISTSAFTTHVLRSVTTSMINRLQMNSPAVASPFRRVVMSVSDQAHLSRTISEAWHLKIGVPSLLAVEQALVLRMSRIYEIASRETLLGPQGRHRRLADIHFLQLHFLQSAAIAVDLFNTLTGEREGKWALAFDELEIAPQWIQDELVKLLRSSDPRFLFKLAMSPHSTSAAFLRRPQSASAGEDFDQIPLWYPNKRDAYSFCEQLWNSMLKNGDQPPKRPQDVLGTSFYHTSAEDTLAPGGAYSYGSRLYKAFEELARIDSSFRRYLANKAIDLKTIQNMAESRRASDIRKIATIVALREYYRREEEEPGSQVRLRSRKRSLFTGAEALFGISEGNPRWFIGITENMLDRWRDTAKPLDESIQAEEIVKASQRYLAMLATIPMPPSAGLPSLVDILESVGTFFYDQAVKADFTAEPPATFLVDNAVPSEIKQILERAVNSGAIVFVPERKDEAFVDDLTNKRFRISYLLAPMYRLPLRLGKATSLSRILILKRPAGLSQLSLRYFDNE